MTFNKCSINGIVYGNLDEIHYGKSNEMIKVNRTLFTFFFIDNVEKYEYFLSIL